MVRLAESARSTAIAGGFVLVPVGSLLASWRACRAAPLNVGDFRALLACRELVARRRPLAGGRAPSYDFPELARLLGVTQKRARCSVRRLEAAGFLEWSGSAIGFPDHELADDDPAGDSIGRGRGSVAIPRRMLRLLAAAEHARAVGTVNPGGLFARLVRGGLWHFATLDDEDVANAKLKRHLWGEPPSRTGPVPGAGAASGPMLSGDARLVREVRAALARAGHRGDPFYALRTGDPAWTRDRWERAVGELDGVGAGR